MNSNWSIITFILKAYLGHSKCIMYNWYVIHCLKVYIVARMRYRRYHFIFQHPHHFTNGCSLSLTFLTCELLSVMSCTTLNCSRFLNWHFKMWSSFRYMESWGFYRICSLCWWRFIYQWLSNWTSLTSSLQTCFPVVMNLGF